MAARSASITPCVTFVIHAEVRRESAGINVLEQGPVDLKPFGVELTEK
jgi:hypothetical protein